MATQVTDELERVLHQAFMDARIADDRVITPEHVLPGLLERNSVISQLESNAVNVAALRSSLQKQIARTPTFPASARDPNFLPSPESQKLIHIPSR